MKQSRSTSFLKSLISTAVGFGLSLLLQWMVLPLLIRAPVPLHANLEFAAIMTVVSVARGYLLERLFELLGWRVRMSPFATAALVERQRQKDVEGWDEAHDDAHEPGELAAAGGCYAFNPSQRNAPYGPTHSTWQPDAPIGWPWSLAWWKPTENRRDLVKACALIIAEGEKFDRNRKAKPRRAF